MKNIGTIDYIACLDLMRSFTKNRHADTQDELWVAQHPPVFTQGQAGLKKHILETGDIPLVQSDRGGQVTYHAPGQIIVYCLLDVRRRKSGVKFLVRILEQAVIDTLQDFDIDSHVHPGSPGVYVQQKKIAAIGLRITQKGSYHGLSLNVSMDMEPWKRINPCGLGLEVISMENLLADISIDRVENVLIQNIRHHLDTL